MALLGRSIPSPLRRLPLNLILFLQGEMRCVPLSSEARVDLPRAGGISYAAQEAWVLNDTIKAGLLKAIVLPR